MRNGSFSCPSLAQISSAHLFAPPKAGRHGASFGGLDLQRALGVRLLAYIFSAARRRTGAKLWQVARRKAGWQAWHQGCAWCVHWGACNGLAELTSEERYYVAIILRRALALARGGVEHQTRFRPLDELREPWSSHAMRRLMSRGHRHTEHIIMDPLRCRVPQPTTIVPSLRTDSNRPCDTINILCSVVVLGVERHSLCETILGKHPPSFLPNDMQPHLMMDAPMQMPTTAAWGSTVMRRRADFNQLDWRRNWPTVSSRSYAYLLSKSTSSLCLLCFDIVQSGTTSWMIPASKTTE